MTASHTIIRLVTAALIATHVSPVRADNHDWVGGGPTTDFQEPTNWHDGAVPRALDSARFNRLGGAYNVTFVDSPTNDRLLVTTGQPTFDFGTDQWHYRLEGVGGTSVVVTGPGIGPTLHLRNGRLLPRGSSIGDGATDGGMARVIGLDAGWVDRADTVIGRLGEGAFTIEDGAFAGSANVIMADAPGSTATATVDGYPSYWTIGQWLVVGRSGDATGLAISHAGRINCTSAVVAQRAGSHGQVLVETMGRLDVSRDLVVGGEDDAEMFVQTGGEVRCRSAIIAAGPGTVGSSVMLKDKGTRWIVDGPLFVGLAGTAELSVRDGAYLETKGGHIGSLPGADGLVRVAGASPNGRKAHWRSYGDIRVGNPFPGATAVVSVEPGGEMTVEDHLGRRKVIRLEGGTIRGVRRIAGDIPGIVMKGHLENLAGSFEPGTGELTGVFNIDGNFVQQEHGRLLIDLAGRSREDEYDAVEVYGDALLGGALTVNVAEPFDASLGDSFEILNAQWIEGRFDEVFLPMTANGLSLRIRYTDQAVLLDVTEPCPADFDGNGAVDAVDLARLLGNWGPTPEYPADLDGNGTIDDADLAILLGAWGPCS